MVMVVIGGWMQVGGVMEYVSNVMGMRDGGEGGWGCWCGGGG
jgi:hypothetical protein